MNVTTAAADTTIVCIVVEAFAFVIVLPLSSQSAITATDLLQIIKNFSLCCWLAFNCLYSNTPILLMLDRVANSRKSLYTSSVLTNDFECWMLNLYRLMTRPSRAKHNTTQQTSSIFIYCRSVKSMLHASRNSFYTCITLLSHLFSIRTL